VEYTREYEQLTCCCFNVNPVSI